MGIGPSRLDAAEAVAELGGSVTYKDSLGGSRFFKSLLCVHDVGGLVVVKVYAKRSDSPELRPHRERLLAARAALAGLDYPHAWPVQRVYESDHAAFLLRQYLHTNLAQRISSRPFLTLVEKRWIAYQLLLALAQCHERGVCHGDIKAENVALNSWDWAYLVDFAPYKPTLLPADNPAQFSLFFDTSGRRKCCIAPERFYDPAVTGLAAQQAAEAPLTPGMDIFSLGCVLAELFLDGQALFDYSRLLAYRLHGIDSGALAALDKVHHSVRGMVAHMVQRDPAQRHTIHQYLQEASAAALPTWLATTVHPFLASMLHLDTDSRLSLALREYEHVKGQLLDKRTGGPAADATSGSDAATAGPPADPPALHRCSREQADLLPTEGTGVRPLLDLEIGGLLSETQASLRQLEARSSHKSGMLQPTTPSSSPGEQGSRQAHQPAAATGSSMPQQPSDQLGDARRESDPVQHEGMVLVAVLLCTLLRGCRMQEHKARAVWLLRDAAAHCDDETRLQRVLPYLVAATAEPLAAVKAVALRALTCVLAQVRSVPPSEAKVFNEYVLPSLSLLPSEAELAVQVEYASCIAQLASTAQTFLEQLQRRRLQHAHGSPSGDSSAAPLLNYDEEMAHLRGGVERVVHDLLVGPHPETKLALLPHLAQLAAFAGRRDTADVLLPSLLTFFNSPSWQVRAAFYAAFVGVCPSLGLEGAAAIVVPFLDRLLGDPDVAVAAEAVGFLAAVTRGGLLRKRHLLMVATRLCARQLLAPEAAVPLRAAAVDFIAAAAGQMSDADVYARLLRLALPHMSGEPLDMRDPQQLLQSIDSNTSQGSKAGPGSVERTPWRFKAPLPPMRPGFPPMPVAPPAQRFGSHSVGEAGSTVNSRRSLGSAPAAGPSSRPGEVVGHAGSAAIVRPGVGGPTAAGSRSMVLLPPVASTYSLQVDPRFLANASSHLSAAIEQSMMAQAGAGGHFVTSTSASRAPVSSAAAGAPSRLRLSAQWDAADSGQQLVARARRSLPHPAGIAHQMRMPAVLPGRQHGELAADPHAAQPAASGSGQGVRDAMSAALAAGMPGGTGSGWDGQHIVPWYPRGVLVAHLAEHKKSVNRLAMAGCGAFFASASSDETVKVWDCRRLDKDVSFRSRLTYTAQAGRITSVAACQDGQTMASGSAAGSIHAWRVEYAARSGGTPERYTGIVGCRQVTSDGSPVLDLSAWGPSLLVYSTQLAGLSAWDLRAGRDAWTLPASPVAGVVQRFALDPTGNNWLLGASSRGQLSVWDIRFRLPVNAWQHPAAAPVSALALASAPAQRLGLGFATGPLVYVAAGEQEVGLWDIADAKCLQVMRVSKPSIGDVARRHVPAALAPVPAAGMLAPRGPDMMSRARQLAISELQAPQAQARREGCRALLATGGGQLLAGGSDRVVRCWDAGRPQQSYVVCAPPPPIPVTQAAGVAAAAADEALAGGAPVLAGPEGTPITQVDVPMYTYSVHSMQGVPVVEESCTLHRSSSAAAASGSEREQHLSRMGWAERAAAMCHQLAVTDLLRVEAGEPLLLSAGADGTIKCWR